MEHASGIATSAVFGWSPLVVATVILIAAYFFIISEKINRAIVSLLGAGLLVLLGVLNFELVVEGIDFNNDFSAYGHDGDCCNHQGFWGFPVCRHL